jgi:hypothetical protein
MVGTAHPTKEKKEVLSAKCLVLRKDVGQSLPYGEERRKVIGG